MKILRVTYINSMICLPFFIGHTHRARLVEDGWGREEFTPQPGLA